MQDTQTPPSSQGTFSLMMSLLGEAAKITLRNFKTIFCVGLLLVLASLGWSILLAAVSPDYTVEQLFQDYLTEYKNEAGVSGGEESKPDWYTPEPGAIDEDTLKGGASEEGQAGELDEKLAEVTGSQAGIIYILVNMVGQIALAIIPYLIGLALAANYYWHKKRMSVGDVLRLVKESPRSFYKAVILKWVVMILPVVLFLVFVFGAIALFGDGDAGKGIVTTILVIMAVLLCAWMCYIPYRLLLVEPIALFETASFRAAARRSTEMMYGRKFKVALAFIVGIIFVWIVAMLLMIPMLIVGILAGLAGAFVAEWLAIAIIVVLMGGGFVALQYTITFLFCAWLFLLWDRLRGQYPLQQD